MKIRIVRYVPVDRKHEIDVGNEYEARYEVVEDRSKYPGYWITGATGEKVKILVRECEEIEEEEEAKG
jgi:hypothetical protein